jgi:hypothetical protein
MYCRLRNRHLAPGASPLATFDLIYTKRVIRPREMGQPRPRDQHLGTYRC